MICTLSADVYVCRGRPQGSGLSAVVLDVPQTADCRRSCSFEQSVIWLYSRLKQTRRDVEDDDGQAVTLTGVPYNLNLLLAAINSTGDSH